MIAIFKVVLRAIRLIRVIGCVFCIFFAVDNYVVADSNSSITFEAGKYNLEIPCGYFYWEYIKSGRWGCGERGGKFKSISLLATVDGLKPYSKVTENEFFDYRNGDSSRVVNLLFSDISYAPYMDNHNYASAYLAGRSVSTSEYEGLRKYVMSRASGVERRVIYIDQLEAGSDGVRFLCYRTKYPYCYAYSCKEDICLRYRVNYELSSWESRHSAIWDLINKFKK